PGHHHPVYAAHPRLRRGRIRPGPAPHGRRHRHCLARLVRPRRRALRPARHAAGGACAHRPPPGAAGPRPPARQPPRGPPPPPPPPLLIFGVGGGLTLPALASLGMSGATQRDAGLASGLFNTAQQIGAALGVAVLSTLAAAQPSGLHATGTGSAAPLAA